MVTKSCKVCGLSNALDGLKNPLVHVLKSYHCLKYHMAHMTVGIRIFFVAVQQKALIQMRRPQN